MQEEGSSSNPFRGNYYYYDNGSSPQSLNLIQLMEAPDPQQDPLGQPDLNQETGRVSSMDLLTWGRSLSPQIHQSSTSQSFEGSMSLGIHQFSSGPTTLQGASSFGALPGSIELNAPSAYSFSDPIVGPNWANPHIMENLIVNGSGSRHHHQIHGFHAANQMGGVSNVRRGHASSSQAAANQIGGVSNVRRGHAISSHASQAVARRRARGPSPHMRSTTAIERRRRLINEVREALDNFRRVGGEHFRELIALGAQFEIIANEVDQIQVVANGLTEDTIVARLTRETYHPAAAGAEEHRACSICQDEYGEGDLLGKLDCGHDYHFECIKQWLMRKNSCPMCRRRALAI